MAKIIQACIADTHIGSTLAIAPPKVPLDGGGLYKPSKTIIELFWKPWLNFWKIGAELKAKYNAPMYAYHGGDVFENDHHGTSQLWSMYLPDWMLGADIVHEPMFDLCDGGWLVRGSRAHAGESGSNEGAWARTNRDFWFGDTTTGMFTWWNLYYQLGVTLIDAQHAGSIGQLPWTSANILNRQSWEMAIAYDKDGATRPHLALRAHNHFKDRSSMSSPIDWVSLPCWQLKTAYIYNRGKARGASFGGLFIVFDTKDPEYELIWFDINPKARTPWKLLKVQT